MDNSLLLALMVQGAAMRVAMETGAPFDRALAAAMKAFDPTMLPDDLHAALRQLEDLAHEVMAEAETDREADLD